MMNDGPGYTQTSLKSVCPLLPKMLDHYRPYPIASDDFTQKMRLISMALIYLEATCNDFRVVYALDCENFLDMQKAELGSGVPLIDWEATTES
jgi:hypothetical protein